MMFQLQLGARTHTRTDSHCLQLLSRPPIARVRVWPPVEQLLAGLMLCCFADSSLAAGWPVAIHRRKCVIFGAKNTVQRRIRHPFFEQQLPVERMPYSCRQFPVEGRWRKMDRGDRGDPRLMSVDIAIRPPGGESLRSERRAHWEGGFAISSNIKRSIQALPSYRTTRKHLTVNSITTRVVR